MTYLRCWEGLVYLALVIDVYSRRVVGWQLASHMRASLVCDALKMAVSTRQRGADVELVHHSDRGARKQRNLTQQALADLAEIHVSQVRRYEGGGAMPTLDVLKKLTVALSTSADSLLFDDHERDPDDDLRLQFEAITRLTDDEKQTVKRVLEGLLIAHNVKHDATRWAA